MRSYLAFALSGCLVLASSACTQQTPLEAAVDALGAAQVNTLQIVGSGRNFSVGQNYTPADPWPPVTVKNYTALIDYGTASARVELVREMGAVMPRGGGAPFFGEQRQIQVVSGDYAWNVPPAEGQPPAPNPDAQPERMLAIWSTPIGFVKAAMANNATTTADGTSTNVSFTVGGKYRMEGTINAQGHVERVLTWFNQPIVGDMPVETTYADYKDFGGGLTLPSRVTQTQDGFPSLELTIASATANPPADITVPENVRAFQPPAVNVTVEKLAEGVFYLKGGSHHSVAIEMADHIVVIDTPQTQMRGEAVLAKAKETIPNKPVRYLVTTHHHWDHLGGIRAAMDEGATIVTHESNREFLERVAKTPHTLAPDRLASSQKAVQIQAIGDDAQLTDGRRMIELHRLQGYDHTADMYAIYLPRERLVIEVDAFTPPAQPGATLIPPAVVNAKALYDNLVRLKLNIRTIVPLHGCRTTDMAELQKAATQAGTN